MGQFHDISSKLKCEDGVLSIFNATGWWVCGAGQEIETLGGLFAYIEGLASPPDTYNVLAIPPFSETGNYAFINANLTCVNIESISYEDEITFGDYQTFDFSGLTQSISFYANNFKFRYDYTTAKPFLAPSVGGFLNVALYGRIFNDSADGNATPIIDSNSAYLYTNHLTEIYIDESSEGGIYNVIAAPGEIAFYCNGATVENVFASSYNCVFNNLTIAGTYASGSNFLNPIIDCDNLIVSALYVSVVGPITLKAAYAGFGSIWCDLGGGAILFDSAARLKIGPGFTNGGQALLHDGGVYTFDGVQWDGFVLDAGFVSCDLNVVNNIFTGTNEGVVGSDFYTSNPADILISGTSESTLYSTTTSTYTFFKSGQELIIESYLTSVVAGGTNNTYRFKVGGSTVYTFTESTNVDLEFTFKLYRDGNSFLRLNVIVLKNGASPTVAHVDISIDPRTNIAIAFTGQGGNAGNQTTQSFRNTRHS